MRERERERESESDAKERERDTKESRKNEERQRERGRETERRAYRKSLGPALRVFRAETRLTVYRPWYSQTTRAMAKRVSEKYDNSFQFMMMI